MKDNKKTFTAKVLGGLCALLCFLPACTGGSATPVSEPTASAVAATVVPDEVAPTVVEAEPEPTEVPTVTPPTAVPTAVPVVVSDEERIAAALAAFEAEPEPAELIAWDLSGPAVNDKGVVTFDVCAWDGQSAFDQTYAAVYDTDAAADGTLTVKRIDVALDSADCLNSGLVDSVWEFIAEFDDYFADVFEDPGSFTDDERTRVLVAKDLETRFAVNAAAAAAAGFADRASPYRGADLPESLVAPALFRRLHGAEPDRLDLVVCQEMDPAYGVYRAGVLVDDKREGTVGGPHSVIMYSLNRDAVDARGWRLVDITDLVWGDCFLSGDWATAVAEWQPSSIAWRPFG